MFKSIITLSSAALIAATLAVPAEAALNPNGIELNALNPNGTKGSGVDAGMRDSRVLTIELPRE